MSDIIKDIDERFKKWEANIINVKQGKFCTNGKLLEAEANKIFVSSIYQNIRIILDSI